MQKIFCHYVGMLYLCNIKLNKTINHENISKNINQMSRSKKTLKVGDKVIFNTGNYAGLTGVITEVDCNSKHKNAIYGFYHTVQLSNGYIGHIEKSEHWQFA